MISKSEELHKYLLHCSRVAPNQMRELMFSNPSPCIVVSFLGFLALNINMAALLLGCLFLYATLFFACGFIVRGVPEALWGVGALWGVFVGAVLQGFFLYYLFVLVAKTRFGLGLMISAFVIFFVVVLTPLIEPPFLPFLPFMLSSIGSWAYANVVFSRYGKLARQRVADIEGESSSTTNNLLEKGVLLLMLARKPQGLEAIKSALTREGGEAFLWNLAGIALSNMKMYSEAKTAFDKATEASPDDRLLKKIKRNLKLVQKKLR